MDISFRGGASMTRPPGQTIDGATWKSASAHRSLARLMALLGLILAVIWLPSARASSLDDAAERYRSYLIEDIERALSGVRTLRERIEAKDLDGAISWAAKCPGAMAGKVEVRPVWPV